MLDARAEQVAAQERGERFLQELATRLHPGPELLELAGKLDDHALGVWREAAASLVDEAPPSLAHLRWRVEEEQRGELRGHAHLVWTESAFGARLRRFSLLGRWWHRGRVAAHRGELANCRSLRERAERRLAYLDAKLLVIERAERVRAAWIADARDVLARGVAALGVLEDRATRPPRLVALPSGQPLNGESATLPSSELAGAPARSALSAPELVRNRQAGP